MAITLNEVTKNYGKVKALDNISVSFEENTLYGLLGDNGAGKTTLLNLICNRIFPNGGRVEIDGDKVENNDSALGKVFMSGETNLYPEDMRVNAAFKTTAIFYPSFDMDYALKLSKAFGLDIKKKITALSTGYGSIFRLITALSVNTPYVLFDEPVLGLDAHHRDMFYKFLIEKYSEKPFCAIISTHLIQEAEGIISHAVIIGDGKIIVDSDCEDILSDCYTVSGAAGNVDAYCQGKDVIAVSSVGGLKTASLRGKPEKLPDTLEMGRMGLQDYFIGLFNNKNGKDTFEK